MHAGVLEQQTEEQGERHQQDKQHPDRIPHKQGKLWRRQEGEIEHLQHLHGDGKQQQVRQVEGHPPAPVQAPVEQAHQHGHQHIQQPGQHADTAEPGAVSAGNSAGNQPYLRATKKGSHAQHRRAAIENQPVGQGHRRHHAEDTNAAKQNTGQALAQGRAFIHIAGNQAMNPAQGNQQDDVFQQLQNHAVPTHTTNARCLT